MCQSVRVMLAVEQRLRPSRCMQQSPKKSAILTLILTVAKAEIAGKHGSLTTAHTHTTAEMSALEAVLKPFLLTQAKP